MAPGWSLLRGEPPRGSFHLGDKMRLNLIRIDSATMNSLAVIQLCPLLISRLVAQVRTDALIAKVVPFSVPSAGERRGQLEPLGAVVQRQRKMLMFIHTARSTATRPVARGSNRCTIDPPAQGQRLWTTDGLLREADTVPRQD
jgi:hypothetical protein